MTHQKSILLAITYAIFSASACSYSQTKTIESASLKEIFKNDFLIGAAINGTQIEEKDAGSAVLLPQQFNSITPENIMKCEIIHPEWDRYNFDLADKYVAYGKKHNMFVVGHTLVWYSQLAPFVKRIKSKDSLNLFMTNHINTVAGRYAGKVNGWDVINEAVDEDGTLRKNTFLEILGEEYIARAFKLAEKATPNTELYYNDYNIEQPKKRAGAVKLLKLVQASGARIDAVGIQGHWSVNNLPLKDIEDAIIEFSSMGLKVMITELDISVLPNPWDMKGADVNQNFAANPALNPYTKGLPDSMQVKLAKNYEALFKLLIKHQDKISRVTFWGVNDGQSWLNGFPIKGRTNYPLLFDRNFKPKLAFEKVIEVRNK
jgi:endo-1,4-beta-xylanase